MKFVLAQVFGLIALLLTVISVHFRNKRDIVLCFVLANLVVAIQFFLLNAITGGIMSIINAVRCFVFYIYNKNNLKPSLIILFLFETIAIVSGIISWQNIFSIIPIILATFYTYALWQDNVKLLRISTAIVGSGWAIYDLIVAAYTGVIQEVSQFISALVAIFKNKD